MQIIKIFKREANLIGSIYEVQGAVDTTYGGCSDCWSTKLLWVSAKGGLWTGLYT